MQMQPYLVEELAFAWCYRVYLRFRTHRRKPNSLLPNLNADTLAELLAPYGIHVLELATNDIEVRTLVSLQPHDSVSAGASKLKGRISKWLAEQGAGTAAKLLGRGYFAVTTGKSTADAVNVYLEQQGEHHGYADRVRPPTFVREFAATSDTVLAMKADHAVTRLRFHVVLATWRRQGVFGQAAAEAVSNRWSQLQADVRVHIEKVSFLPDHVHIALTLHPGVVPADATAMLMNAAQDLMWNRFERDVIQARVERLWRPSAYVGSFGELTSNAVSAYVSRWEANGGE